ncbi:FkbM family methyltransferase [Nodularia spumigena CS-586/05]|uniref:FkbM family methyltransferase n=1 Tax=Nodularia spumigena TaxID=70799 RepID=UPI00232AA36B|nr:FkbM family methyltransferase [Nodularia spumigena]MDB9345597.1 FkbM family methyltransferase [Nodularia spumigena CS-588/06]MDB9368678.1 FkbM family methyltransferase [Nodularia spumigena CS-586/05]
MNLEPVTDHVYLQYIQKLIPCIQADNLSKIALILENTAWDEPESSADWNNIAVAALSEAEQCHDNLTMRSVYLEMAVEALNNGLSIDGHPICAAHLALIHSIIGETSKAVKISFNTLIKTFQSADVSSENQSNFLIYIFADNNKFSQNEQECWEEILLSRNSYQQALFLLNEVIHRSQIAFYTGVSRRFLHLAAQLSPNSVNTILKLGISTLMAGEQEGILYLHQARKLVPDSAPILQALYLAYRNLNQIEVADYWQKVSRQFYQSNSLTPEWSWTQLPASSSFTYVPFESNIILAVEPSLRSIATSVLISEQDWFEKEMEFWRNSIKPGMTVIDVGANIGVYTFSAAVKVGSEGRVFAIEPFSVCVNSLQETCRINQFSWVNVCAGAASDRNGNIKLLLHSANELNQVVSDDAAEQMDGCTFQEAKSFTLDSLIQQENITQVDFLKLDAEGHEMAVLLGSEKLITEFAPVILYENIAGSQGSNIEVAQYLKKIGYELFHYQPYTNKLIAVNSDIDFQEQLNFIALTPEKRFMFDC